MIRRSATSAAAEAAPLLFLIATAATGGDAAPGSADDFRAAAALHGAAASDPDHAGIWKGATPPPGSTHGEFDSHDPIALAAGVKLQADCSINWIEAR